jgi:energy-coupling factor transporter ATP-binding protein EcfA2
MQPIEIFISYSDRDQEGMQALEKHLSLLKQQGMVRIWHKRKIEAASETVRETDAHLNSAHLILLLVSADFLASEHHYQVELKRAMERHHAQEACVIPVILRPVDWENAAFGKLQSLPRNRQAIAQWQNQDQAWQQVVQEIRGAIATPGSITLDTNLEELVHTLRQQFSPGIHQRCGTMRVLDMTYPIGLGAIYTDVNILERITGRTRRDLGEFIQGCQAEDFDRFFLGKVQQQRVDGLVAVRTRKHLMILGRPGAGKTTFLKRLATLCKQGEFLPERVPIFVTLKEFAEAPNQPGLVEFIATSYLNAPNSPAIAQLLQQGRGLVLLDGLDEVLETQHDRVLREIEDFARRYEQSSILITCRIAAREYIFQQFTEVEVADFTDQQIQDFADKWFKTKEPDQVDTAGKSAIASLFWQALKAQKPIKELATNPLLLTLLCLEFEQSSEFPKSRAELYDRALNVLLSKWDGQRRIKRDEVYKRLPVNRKESLLGQLAMQTFEQGQYFFRSHVIKRIISQYIQNLPDASTDPDALLVDSTDVLKSIESQHGLLTERAADIYSFSHLTFHEYFTAKNILECCDVPREKQDKQHTHYE